MQVAFPPVSKIPCEASDKQNEIRDMKQLIQTVREEITFCLRLQMIYEDLSVMTFFWSFENSILPFASISKKKGILRQCLLTIRVVGRKPWLGLARTVRRESGVALTNFKCSSCSFLHLINLVPDAPFFDELCITVCC